MTGKADRAECILLSHDDTDYVEPDISIICDIDKLDDKGCSGAPDWIAEIVSPASRRMDYFVKLFKYRSAGVREYWIVDAAKNRITVWNFDEDSMEDYTFADAVPMGIYKDFSIDFSGFDLQ